MTNVEKPLDTKLAQTKTRPTAWPKRLFVLDVSRGFAAISVILWHWQHFAYQRTTLPHSFSRNEQPFYSVLKLFYEAGHLGVEYFFLLSGFIFFWLYKTKIENRQVGFIRFWVLRFSRLYPLHFVTLLIVAGLQTLYIRQNSAYFVYSHNDFYHFLLNLGFASRWGLEQGQSFNAPVWSVSIEILLYLAFFLVVFTHLGRTSVCLSLSLISFTLYLPMPNPIWGGLSLFFWGSVVYRTTFLLSTKYVRYRPIIYLFALLSWLLLFINFHLFDIIKWLEQMGLTGIIILRAFPFYMLYPFTISSLTLLEIQYGNFLQPLAWLGDITYSSYLLHFPLQLLTKLAISYGLLSVDSRFYLKPGYLLAFFGLLLPLSYLTYIGFERPLQMAIRKKMLPPQP